MIHGASYGHGAGQGGDSGQQRCPRRTGRSRRWPRSAGGRRLGCGAVRHLLDLHKGYHTPPRAHAWQDQPAVGIIGAPGVARGQGFARSRRCRTGSSWLRSARQQREESTVDARAGGECLTERQPPGQRPDQPGRRRTGSAAFRPGRRTTAATKQCLAVKGAGVRIPSAPPRSRPVRRRPERGMPIESGVVCGVDRVLFIGQRGPKPN